MLSKVSEADSDASYIRYTSSIILNSVRLRIFLSFKKYLSKEIKTYLEQLNSIKQQGFNHKPKKKLTSAD